MRSHNIKAHLSLYLCKNTCNIIILCMFIYFFRGITNALSLFNETDCELKAHLFGRHVIYSINMLVPHYLGTTFASFSYSTRMSMTKPVFILITTSKRPPVLRQTAHSDAKRMRIFFLSGPTKALRGSVNFRAQKTTESNPVVPSRGQN